MNAHGSRLQPSASRKAWLPYGVFVVTFGLTLIAAYYADAVSRTRERVRFDHAASQAQASIEDVVKRYVALQHAVRSIGVAHLNMSPEQFRVYVKALDLEKNYPAIHGLGVAARVKQDQKDEALRKVRAKGLVSFHIWPESDRPDVCPVIILEPTNNHNLTMIGYDLLTEPARRDAAQRAVETGELVATTRIKLATEALGRESGFLILGPLYRSGNVPEPIEERNRNWAGFVYCFFLADDFFKAVITPQSKALLNFRVYDGTELSGANLMHDSGAMTTVQSSRNSLMVTNTIFVAGRSWTLIAAPTLAFMAASGANFGPFILVAGGLLSSLLAWFTAMQFRARVQAENSAALLRQSEKEREALNLELEQRVRERTSQLEMANKELEAFSYSVSHDLRAPLRHIDGYVQLLQTEAGQALGDTHVRFLKVIGKSARSMGQLINDLLLFSQIGRARLAESKVNLKHLCEETIRSLESEVKGRDIHWTIGDLPVTQGDSAMLGQVFANLLGNAVKYTRGRVPAEIEIGCKNGKPHENVVFVRDNGAGFDMKYADKLFGVFERLHTKDEFEGTGIGLANVKRIVTRHGGRCWAEGIVDRGATFYFSLPTLGSAATSFRPES